MIQVLTGGAAVERLLLSTPSFVLAEEGACAILTPNHENAAQQDATPYMERLFTRTDGSPMCALIRFAQLPSEDSPLPYQAFVGELATLREVALLPLTPLTLDVDATLDETKGEEAVS